MSIDTRKLPTEEEADHRHMVEHAFKGKPLDPEVAKRVHQRADMLRAEMKAAGIKIDAVELIRESREEL
jgi:hypothetical protein